MGKKPTFDIKTMLNVDTINEVTQMQRKIRYDKLVPNENNHYSLGGIEELADSIEDIGLQQELVVKPMDDGLYKIIVGHRRHLAITMLVEERGLTDLAEVPCKISSKDEDDTITELKLHLTNTTARELTEHDKMVAIAELKRLIEDAKSKGIKIKGTVRDLIGTAVKLKGTQVQKYINIQEKATPETKEALRKGEITVQEANESIRPKKKKPAEDVIADAAQAPTALAETAAEDVIADAVQAPTALAETAVSDMMKENTSEWKTPLETPKNNTWVNVIIIGANNNREYKLLYYTKNQYCLGKDNPIPNDVSPIAWVEIPALPEWLIH